MKSILLLRHALLEGEAEGSASLDSPLCSSGAKAARKMGRWAASAGIVPEHALLAPALGVRQTLALAAAAGRWDGPARLSDALARVDPEALLDEIRATPDGVGVLAVVGHEPGLVALVRLLVGGGAVALPAAAAAHVELPAERWPDTAAASGTLATLLPPRAFEPGVYRELRQRDEAP